MTEAGASKPVLWHFPISHFCEKVRWALDWKSIPHERVVLGPSYLRVWWRTGGRAMLPALVLDGRVISDSTRILAELERRWPEPALYPSGALDLERALEVEDYFDEQVGHALRAAIVGDCFERSPEYALAFFGLGQGRAFAHLAPAVAPLLQRLYRWRHEITDETSREGWKRIEQAIDRIEAELGPEGYLVGDRPSVADLTAVALLAPFLTMERYVESITGGDLPELLRRLPEWFVKRRAPLLERPGGRWVVETYARLR